MERESRINPDTANRVRGTSGHRRTLLDTVVKYSPVSLGLTKIGGGRDVEIRGSRCRLHYGRCCLVEPPRFDACPFH